MMKISSIWLAWLMSGLSREFGSICQQKTRYWITIRAPAIFKKIYIYIYINPNLYLSHRPFICRYLCGEEVYYTVPRHSHHHIHNTFSQGFFNTLRNKWMSSNPFNRKKKKSPSPKDSKQWRHLSIRST